MTSSSWPWPSEPGRRARPVSGSGRRSGRPRLRGDGRMPRPPRVRRKSGRPPTLLRRRVQGRRWPPNERDDPHASASRASDPGRSLDGRDHGAHALPHAEARVLCRHGARRCGARSLSAPPETHLSCDHAGACGGGNDCVRGSPCARSRARLRRDAGRGRPRPVRGRLRPHAVFPREGAALQKGSGWVAEGRRSAGFIGDEPFPKPLSPCLGSAVRARNPHYAGHGHRGLSRHARQGAPAHGFGGEGDRVGRQIVGHRRVSGAVRGAHRRVPHGGPLDDFAVEEGQRPRHAGGELPGPTACSPRSEA